MRIERATIVTSAIVVVGSMFLAWPARAHIKLLKPASWLNEDGSGGPQKGGPCGPGGSDDVQPIPVSGATTTFHAGETITVEWEETVAHPGYFRIALAASRDQLADPAVAWLDASGCDFDESKLPTGAHDNVLADGVSFRSRTGFVGSSEVGKVFSQQVTLPNEPCEHCTLQVIQLMESHSQPCFYHHCADVIILPAATVDAGGPSDGGVATGGETSGDAGTADAGSVTPDDAGPPDASARDAAAAADAGPRATGNVDAGAEDDAGGGTQSGAGASPDASDGAKHDSDGGCSLAASDACAAAWSLLLLGALALRRRRMSSSD